MRVCRIFTYGVDGLMKKFDDENYFFMLCVLLATLVTFALVVLIERNSVLSFQVEA